MDRPNVTQCATYAGTMSVGPHLRYDLHCTTGWALLNVALGFLYRLALSKLCLRGVLVDYWWVRCPWLSKCIGTAGWVLSWVLGSLLLLLTWLFLRWNNDWWVGHLKITTCSVLHGGHGEGVMHSRLDCWFSNLWMVNTFLPERYLLLQAFRRLALQEAKHFLITFASRGTFKLVGELLTMILDCVLSDAWI
jgi:hypothetical protein